MNKSSRGTIEALVAGAVVQFLREQHGRGPADVRVTIIGDLILVRCGGIFTVTESRLVATDEGRKLIKSARQELRAIARIELEALITTLTGCQVLRSYSDVNVEAAEQMDVFVLGTDLEKRLLRHELDALSEIGPKRSPNQSRAQG